MLQTAPVVAVFHTHEQAEKAILELQSAGVCLKSLSIAAKDTHTEEHAVGYYNIGDRMQYSGQAGAYWNGFWGLLFGSALFAIPGLGPILVAGPLVTWIVASLEGGAVGGGVSALSAALAGVGIPNESVTLYEAALRRNKFLLVVHGTQDEMQRRRELFATMDITEPVSLTLTA